MTLYPQHIARETFPLSNSEKVKKGFVGINEIRVVSLMLFFPSQDDGPHTGSLGRGMKNRSVVFRSVSAY